MDVAVVTVGDELLAGETENTNATWLCRRLTERGARVRRVVTLPDDEAAIARVVNEFHAEYDATVVTGGLGPTHDDRTMAGVAVAFGRELAHSEVAEEWLVEHGGYSAGDLVDGTADVPAGARVLHNVEGVAPGAVVESTYVLPGVPAEMRAMFEDVAGEFDGERTYVETVFAAEPESALVDRFERVQTEFDVAVGSYPGDGVRIRVSGPDEAEVDAAVAWLRERVDGGEE
ncbi:competence/damage-inducible protein A [Halorubellus sp. JP-L1]|uniref:competence/damage-inducible protein A n=1 Tax=Halorubellus sp. JP-L1 TaxID=2715753 RepID=UPI00140DD0B1|nr:molybdopterin-binding protein [Halorubellus sp. JP-L1]NHN42678.1 competence/damage-inducible protein A [Halorubellus sp. JP-L1]